VALLVVLWAVPVAAVFALELPTERSESDVLDGAGIQTAPVGERVHTMRTDVQVELTLADPSDVAAGAGGLVTAVHAAPGVPVTPGMLLAEVDGVGVLANRDARPYHRELAQGAQGADVAQLNALLQTLTLPAATDPTRFTAATSRGVKALQAQLGATPDGIFRPAYTWFVPADFDVVAAVPITVGDLLAPGDVTLTGARPAQSAAILTDDTESSAETLSSLGDQAVDLVFGGQRIPLPALTLAGPDAQALREQLAAAGAATQQAPDSGALPGAGTEVFGGLVLELRDPPTFGAVPRSALYTSPTGTLCLFEVTTTGSTQGAQAVALPVGAGTGFEVTAALVPADLVGTEVVVAPTRLPAEVRAQCT
jgi:peptidoglycan hydrolase-like protein with peptidoglycan-binding domain